MAGLLSGAPEQPPPREKDLRSANCWANGNDQNCGNFITDRPTTRLHAAPGGKSQMASMLAWDTTDDDRRPPQRSPLKKQQHETGKIGQGAYDAVGGAPRAAGAPAGAPRAAANGYAPMDRPNPLLGGSPGRQDARPPQGMDPRMQGYDPRMDAQGPDPRFQGMDPRMDPRGPPMEDPRMAPMDPRMDPRGPPMDPPMDPRGPPMDPRMDARSPDPRMQQRQDARSPITDGFAGSRQGASSNQFACGNNQNCGNMITDRRITKINAPPGGHSSFKLG